MRDSLSDNVRAQAAHFSKMNVERRIDSRRGFNQARLDERRQSAETEGLRILIVEDDVTVGPLLAEILEDLGHVVCAVEVDVGDAVSASVRWLPDLMIVDVGLGEVRGAAEITTILRDGSVPCVFVTDDILLAPSRMPGAVLIRKPFRAPDIVGAIHRAMSGRA
jgi:CheY-like chemotaxis protein